VNFNKIRILNLCFHAVFIADDYIAYCPNAHIPSISAWPSCSLRAMSCCPWSEWLET